MSKHCISDLIKIFNQCFKESHQTILVAGGDEPVYLPKNSQQPYHEIHFAHGYFSSALHEIAHWLIAGEQRRLLEDYGYWYAPDGRDDMQQKEFMRLEARPQALESILAKACGFPFQISLDNLNGPSGDVTAFKAAIMQEVKRFHEVGLSERMMTMIDALTQFYQRESEEC